MALNYPGPYELRFYYTISGSFDHVMRLNVKLVTDPDPGDGFDTMTADGNGGLDTQLDTWISQLMAVIKPLYGTAATFQYVELWKYTPGTFDAQYISTLDITEAGTSGTPSQAAGQTIFVFRTVEGGVMKMSLMEPAIIPGPSLAFTGMTTPQKNLVTEVLASTSPIQGRDTSAPFAFVKMHPGTNERLFKRKYRV